MHIQGPIRTFGMGACTCATHLSLITTSLGGTCLLKLLQLALVGRQWVSCAAPWVAIDCAIAGAPVHNGNIYFTGSYFLAYCQLGSLVKACVQPDGVSDTKEIWNLAPFPADYRMGIVAYGKLLICYRYDLYAPSPDNGSWIYVGRLPHGGDSLTLKTLSTGTRPPL